ncbi:MAG: nitroreductase family protein, partial [Paramuribaculum sp.]|nr:nitroreductase family protein [Paramuribaculum sp.]
MEFSKLVGARYSCKKYSDRSLDDATLQSILDMARQAPTAKNLQEQHIYVARSAKSLEAVDAVTPCRYGAPVVLIVAFDKTNVYTYPGGTRDSGIEDASIVATHL